MPKEILGYFFILHNALKYAVSVFHALAIVTYNPELAKNCIRSVLSQQREDGFISSMVSPYLRDEVYPYQCERKGKPPTPPDWRKQVHSISDFNWSSCFTLMFIQNELYLD